jgi:TrpR-related protein YerC/YecD
MPRMQPKRVSFEERKALLDEFWTMIALLESRDEVANFFKDLLSETEALMLARRIQIAKHLLEGSGYDEICLKLHTSPSTVASVHRWLQSGFGGYAKSLPKLKQELIRRQKIEVKKIEQSKPFSGEWLKKRYPLHYLLFNLIDWAELKPPKKLRKPHK